MNQKDEAKAHIPDDEAKKELLHEIQLIMQSIFRIMTKYDAMKRERPGFRIDFIEENISSTNVLNLN